MLEEILTERPRCAERLRAGPAGPHIDRYVEWLVAQRYKPGTMSIYLHALARYCAWLVAEGRVIGKDAIEAFAAFRSHLADRGVLYRPKGTSRGKLTCDISAIRKFTEFLVDVGVAMPAPQDATIEERYPILGDFADWAKRHRGLQASSVRVYLTVLERFVRVLGEDPSTYTAATVRGFVLAEGGKFGVERATTITIATRALLRFLFATGRLPSALDGAIPFPARWGLASLPRFIEPEEVDEALAACDPATPAGQRDRAIVLLFARLGLRAGEVAGLRFDDIDWSRGVLGVSGKGRRRHWMPLPQEVGDAILAYMQGTRPRIADPHVFLRLVAPYRRLGMEAVANVGVRALRRAGVRSPSYGSHVFRHSVATTMLRNGASLEGVGAVLRHRRPETTAIYAKVDLGMLAEIAQPWPEASPC